AYEETLDFLQIIGTKDKVHFQKKLEVFYRDPIHGQVALSCPNLPAPLHLLVGALRLKNLAWSDKWALLKAGSSLLKLRWGTPPEFDQMSAAEWLLKLGQTKALRRAVWDPIIIATLNESPERASAFLLGEVLRRGFLTTRKHSYLGFSATGLSALYVEPSLKYLEQKGAKIETGAAVTGIQIANGRVQSLVLQNGEERAAGAYVLALSPQGLARVLRNPPLSSDPFFERAARIECAPIVSVNLWLDRSLNLEGTYVGLLDSPVQWIFDRRKMVGEGSDGRHPYALVTSAAHELSEKNNSQIAEMAIDAVRNYFPEAKDAKVLHSSVVKEPHATFSAGPGFEKLRLPQKTPLENLFLAGDWTDTKLPATLESAALSGRLAAEGVRDCFER
ncbi:MAG: hydroxysqualene dehydroxylase HpnE, partial [Bdellovibrionota bacterium]